MLNVAVCDDELAIRIKMEEILNRYPGYPCRIRLFENGRQLLADTESFDIVFLDVDMPGLDGIQTAGKLRERDKKVKILYLSAYQDFAPSAFSVHAFAYLVKPAREEDLWRQLDEAIEYMHLEEPKTVLDFQTTEGRIRFAAEDILYFEYMERKVYIHTVRGSYGMSGRITDVAEKMGPFDFCMPHKSFVVNLYHVKSIKGPEVTLMNGCVLPLSQKKAAAFRERMNAFLLKRI
ncbi:LytR/AlgR family response regulator transcription factor [Diplocloster modestus]|uniref:Stage 0 sporulation protein A homolog n=1 Tax=Diplocloster modestus TaxID=2850322 RepID=A0ABS6K987_9FIRM|nr:LytTR family DNA-binding domain-containing protein [Diplocloster modestus]MBU9727083.1 LytTR family DNA-binding domain-containing protein [Diplocloster modestus]